MLGREPAAQQIEPTASVCSADRTHGVQPACSCQYHEMGAAVNTTTWAQQSMSQEHSWVRSSEHVLPARGVVACGFGGGGGETRG
jgi:hypothetical protein